MLASLATCVCRRSSGHEWTESSSLHHTSDSVTRVNDSTRVTIFGDSDSTRVTLRKMVTRLKSSHVFHRMTRLESQSITRVRAIFTKSLSSWWTNPLRVHLKKWAFLLQWWSRLAQIFCFTCLVVLYYILWIKRPNMHRGRPETLFHWRVSRAQNIDTLSWFNSVFEHCYPGNRSHTVTWVFSRYQ